jgi:hypothetical protein
LLWDLRDSSSRGVDAKKAQPNKKSKQIKDFFGPSI